MPRQLVNLMLPKIQTSRCHSPKGRARTRFQGTSHRPANHRAEERAEGGADLGLGASRDDDALVPDDGQRIAAEIRLEREIRDVVKKTIGASGWRLRIARASPMPSRPGMMTSRKYKSKEPSGAASRSSARANRPSPSSCALRAPASASAPSGQENPCHRLRVRFS